MIQLNKLNIGKCFYYNCSDHLPVLAKFSIYLTLPSFEDIEKSLNQSVLGKLIYKNVKINYDFTDAFCELELEPKFPMKLKLSASFFINKKVVDSKSIDIKVNTYPNI
jgi:hypothetical protein